MHNTFKINKFGSFLDNQKFQKIRAVLILMVGIFATACHEDSVLLDNGVIGDPNFGINVFDQTQIVAYSRKAAPVQTNDLTSYQLGFYNDPVYGKNTSNILSQLVLGGSITTLGTNPKIENVFLEIPYFSTVVEEVDEDTKYELDSVFGNTPINLYVYESKYYLRDSDPSSGFENPQNYYSNQAPVFENYLGELLFEGPGFLPSKDEVILPSFVEDEEVTKVSPRARFALDTLFFKNKIFDYVGQPELQSNVNFQNHLRGIYLKVEAVGDEGMLMLLNIRDAKFQIIYSNEDEDGNRKNNELNISFGGIAVNVMDYQLPSMIDYTLSNPNTTLGEENLYLKGGAGTMTIIDLFGPDNNGNKIPDQLEEIRENNWLINEAHIVLQVNQDIVSGGKSEPERIFVYDMENKSVLADFFVDSQTSESDILNYKSQHLGRLERNSSGHGVQYKLRITDYINDLVNKDSTNVRLGLVVSQNVGQSTFQELFSETAPGFKETINSSVMSPQGTVLYGSNAAEDKKIKLNIYYTELFQ